MWLAMMVLMPWAGGAVREWVTELHWVYARTRMALYALLVALVLSLFGRPRLILPIAIACLGTGLLWLFSTMF